MEWKKGRGRAGEEERLRGTEGGGGGRGNKKLCPPTSAGVFALVNLKVDSFPPAALIEKDSPSSATVVLPNLPIVESNSSR